MGRWGVGFGEATGQDANAAGPREIGADPRDFDYPELKKGMLKGDASEDEAPASEAASTPRSECSAGVDPAAVVQFATNEELRARAEHDGGDDDDGCTDALAEIRRRRMLELRIRQEKRLQEEEQRAQMPTGSIEFVPTQEEYKQVLLQAPEGQWVVCLLTADGDPDSEHMRTVLGEVARENPSVRFAVARARTAVPSIPRDVLPTVLLREGGPGSGAKQVAGMGPWGVARPQPRDVAAKLAELGVPVAAVPIPQSGGADTDEDEDEAEERSKAARATESRFSIL